jgi:hypothetical protein
VSALWMAQIRSVDRACPTPHPTNALTPPHPNSTHSTPLTHSLTYSSISTHPRQTPHSLVRSHSLTHSPCLIPTPHTRTVRRSSCTTSSRSRFPSTAKPLTRGTASSLTLRGTNPETFCIASIVLSMSSDWFGVADFLVGQPMRAWRSCLRVYFLSISVDAYVFERLVGHKFANKVKHRE